MKDVYETERYIWVLEEEQSELDSSTLQDRKKETTKFISVYSFDNGEETLMGLHAMHSSL